MMSENYKVKLCPFCGNRAKFVSSEGLYKVQCTSCGCETTPHTKKIAAAKRWNDRTVLTTFSWVLCEKELPKESGDYLVTYRVWNTAENSWSDSKVSILRYSARDKCFGVKRFTDIQAWMVLPKEYVDEWEKE